MQQVVRSLDEKKYGQWTFFETADLDADPKALRDVLNQEFNFSGKGEGGRIDVLATFNDRRSLVVVEVKAGCVGEAECRQLEWYLENWSDLKEADERLADVREVVGVLLAEGFMPLRPGAVREDVYFVRFKMEPGRCAFSVVKPDRASAQEAPSPVLKHSRLVTIHDHRNYLRDDSLRKAFDRLTWCCLDSSSERRDWVCRNPKGGHVAIHYKGRYIIWVFVKQQCFDVGFEKANGENDKARIKVDNLDRVSSIATEILATLDRIDKELEQEIPAEFSWRSC